MSPSKLKIAAVPLLLAATVGLAGTVGFHNARQRKLAQAGARDPEPPTAVDNRPFPYSDTTPVGEDVPRPDEYSMSAQMQSILFQTYFNARTPEREYYRTLRDGAVVVTNPPLDRLSVAEVYAKVDAQGRDEELSVPAGTALSILTAGPLLQPYDQVIVRGLARSGKRVELQVAYAHTQLGTVERPKAEDWRPLLLVPLILPGGAYELRVTWRKYATPSPTTRLEDGKPVDQPPLVYEYRFKVPEGVAESPVVRAGKADFQTLAEGQCRMGQDTEWRNVHLGLRVTNRGDKALLFDPRGLGLFAESLKTADGRLLRYGGGNDGTIVARPLSLPPGKSHLFIVRALLEWGRGGEALRLSGSAGSGDFYWYYQGLTFGKYDLTFEYAVIPQPLRPPETYWTGRVRSGAATIEIVP
jgi:hypothetical protein